MKTSTQFFTWRKAIKQSELPASTRLVLFVIADYANAMDDVCWPSLETIASDAGLSVRCVSDHLKIAEQGGWLTRWRSRRANRRWAHGSYRLSVPDQVAQQFRTKLDFELASDESSANSTHEMSSFADESAYVLPSFADESELPCAGPAMASAPPATGATKLPKEQAPVSKSAGDDANHWNHLPTNTPVNRNTSKPSLQHTTAVNEGYSEAEREFQQKDEMLASWMLERLRLLNSGFREPDLKAWASEIAAMRTVDGRTHPQMAVLFRWANEDGFWHKVVLSPATLRQKWDQLVIRRNAAKRVAPLQSSPTPPADDRQCMHIEHGCRCTHIATSIIGAGSSRRGYCREHIGIYED
ncbi:helix-turn-helix domain-containing protein [Caballeronia sp. LjRoot31]|uniref:helix-turn-helix domain-containing protein n=1 Tax=Caballeronia sp. LjRoot31 TaxID=3342324 RepID=UPI003ED11D1F